MEEQKRDRDEEFWSEAARATALNPGGWLYAADMLKQSADLVLDEHLRALEEWRSAFNVAALGDLRGPLAEIQLGPFLTPVYLMLAGLALENLVKGTAIAKEPRHGEPDDRGRLFKWGHLSVELCSSLGVVLSDSEEPLVARLGRFVEWAGRYPAPRYARQLATERDFNLPSGRDAIDLLFVRLRVELVVAAPFHAERLEQERIERGRTACASLRRLPHRDTDGVRQFFDEGREETTGSWTACIGCGKAFSLAPATPAAICACGDFHYGWDWYDGSLNRVLFRTDVLHEAEIVTE